MTIRGVSRLPACRSAITILTYLDIKEDMEWFYLCSQDYGTLCFLPSDRDIQIPHGRLPSTAWSSAECRWHRSPSNRSKSSTPAIVRPLRRQPQPNQRAKRWQTEMGGIKIARTFVETAKIKGWMEARRCVQENWTAWIQLRDMSRHKGQGADAE